MFKRCPLKRAITHFSIRSTPKHQGPKPYQLPTFASFVFLPHICVPQSGLDLEKTDVYGIVFAEHEKMQREVRMQTPYHPSGS